MHVNVNVVHAFFFPRAVANFRRRFWDVGSPFGKQKMRFD